MSGLALSASFGQALTAMLLVYGGFSLFEMTARQASFAGVKVFAPASFAAIGLIGLYLIWRGLRSLWVQPATRSDHHHDHTGHDHKHGPSVADANAVDSWRAAIGLVASISVRPCTGAIFVLVICWQLGLNLLGMASVLAMATGTAAFTILVAVLAVGARRASFFASADSFAVRLVAPTLQVFVGFAIAALASVMLSASLG